MIKRQLFSERAGLRKDEGITLRGLIEYFEYTTTTFRNKGYFDEAMGSGNKMGTMGASVHKYITLKLRREIEYPINPDLRYKKEDIFDLIELLYDHVSVTEILGMYDQVAGQELFRSEVNAYLSRFGDGWELTTEGEVCLIPEEGMQALLEQPIESTDEDNVTSRVRSAISLYRRRSSETDDKKNAIRELGDVIEYLKAKYQPFLNKDESDLTNILNNFAIHHHNLKQQSDYDKDIYYDWMFYFYLSAVHAASRLAERKK